MPRPSLTDSFDTELEVRLADWRNAAPPLHLKARIAAEIGPAPTRALSWHSRYPLLVGAAGIAAVGVYLLWPGSPVRPAPAFAEIARTLETAESLSCTSVMDTKFRDGATEHQVTRTWMRRNPPAVVTEEVSRYKDRERQNNTQKKTIRQGDQEIQIDEQTHQYRVVKSSSKELVSTIDRTFFAYTRPGVDHASVLHSATGTRWDISAWSAERVPLEGRSVWLFVRTVHQSDSEVANPVPENNQTTRISVWAEPETRHVVRCELRTTWDTSSESRQIVSTDFHYNEPPPMGLETDPPAQKPH